ncbi:MAG TPA: ABC transporter substrate binding protein [Azonexus sp.]
MTKFITRVLAAILLLAGGFPATADVTRIAVIYAEGDDPGRQRYSEQLSGIDRVPGIEIIHLALKDLDDPRLGRLLLAAAQRNAPIRLATAGGGIGPIAVLYPDIGEPYRSVFSKIIEGIEENAETRITTYAVGSNFNAEAISGELKRRDIRVVIALGRNGLRAASALDKDIGVVAGGVVSVPDGDERSGAILSLAPDPALLFAKLKSLSPKSQRIHVVFDPRQNGWLIKLAREAARAQGFELLAQEAGDLKSGLAIYQSIFASADPRRDALWLPQDSATVDDSLVLPLVLQESWARSIPVFSSNVSHVKRGALFALYPDNVELGRNLAASAVGLASGNPAVRGVLPLRNVLTAFNTRTAGHLGLAPSPLQQRSFSLLFPEQ